jgi:hypothetical protein
VRFLLQDFTIQSLRHSLALAIDCPRLKLGINSKVTNAIQDMQKYFVRAKPIPMTTCAVAKMVIFFGVSGFLLFTRRCSNVGSTFFANLTPSALVSGSERCEKQASLTSIMGFKNTRLKGLV